VPLLFPSGCRLTSGPDLVGQERRNIQTWTVPPGAAVVDASEVDGRRLTGRTGIEISTNLGWDQYLRWVDASSKPGYAGRASGSTTATFVRILPGDELRVDLQVIAPGPPLSVRITFTATPD
jgi:hypothetical protein